MKKRILTFILTFTSLITAVFGVTACSSVEFKVDFVVDGAVYATVQTNGSEIIKMPENPTKEDHVFDGWYWDKDVWQKPFTANSLLDAPLSSDMRVYAKFVRRHTHEYQETITPPTCTKTGYTIYTCDCGDTYKGNYVKKRGHDYLESVTPASCTERGYTTFKCSTCGHEYTDNYVDALTHDYNIATNGDGTHTKTCQNDTTHTEVEICSGGEATCLEKAVCDFCNTSYGEKANHSFTNYVSNNDSSCLEDGTKTAICDKVGCNETDTVADVGSATGHKYTNMLIEPTCTTEGSLVCYCDCGERYVAEYYAALNHNYDAWISNGDGTHTKTCMNNNNHIVTETCKGGYATCEEKAVCSSCHGEYGEKLGHNYGEWEKYMDDKHIKKCKNYDWHCIEEYCYGGEATCEEKAVCIVCKNQYGQPKGHNYVNKVCTVCSQKEPSQGLAYSLEYDYKNQNKHAVLTGIGTCTDRDVVIASKYMGYPVTKIRGISNNKTITTLTVPDSVESIQNFNFLMNLTRVELGRGVKYFGNTFSYCERLVEVINKSPHITVKKGEGDYSTIGYFALSVSNCDDNYISKISYDNGLIIYTEGADKILVARVYDNESVLVLPNYITKINHYALKGHELKEVTIPNTVTSIGGSIFSDCSNLETIVLPFIGGETIDGEKDDTLWYLFGGRHPESIPTSLKNIVVTNTETIASNAFISCASLKTITLPSMLKNIGKYAFAQCTAEIIWDENAIYSEIEEYTFYNYKGEKLLVPNSVIKINENAFSYCSALLEWGANPSITSIGSRAFDDCECASLTIPNSVKVLEEEALFHYRNLKSITIPNSVTSIGGGAFYSCDSLTKVNYLGTIDEWVQIEFNSNPLNYADNLYINDVLVTEAKITTANKINAYAFSGWDSLTSVTIGDNVTSIGDGAFRGCKSLTSITIPNSVTSIGFGAFVRCDMLESMTVPFVGAQLNGIKDTHLGYWFEAIYAIYNSNYVTTSLKEVIITGGASIGNEAFRGCGSLTSVTIGDSVTSIGSAAFAYCYSLTSITIPNSVTNIGSSAFSNCDSLTSITIPNSVTSIGSSAFSNCDSLTSITIPNSVTSIGSSAFSNCEIGRAHV